MTADTAYAAWLAYWRQRIAYWSLGTVDTTDYRRKAD